MKIAFDGRVLRHRTRSGVENYAESIVDILSVDFNVLFPFFENRYYQQFWEHTFLPIKARKYAMLFCPANIAPRFLSHRVKLVVTLHDLAFLDFPEMYSRPFQLYYRLLVPAILKRADKVITVSIFAKQRILERFPEIADKVTVIHHGLNPVFLRTKHRADKFVLYVGSLNGMKNFKSVLKIFMSPNFVRYHLKLIVADSKSFSFDGDTEALLQKAKKSENIEFFGQMNVEALSKLYASASLMVLPSFHESFGFPALEAMACGTPVVVSKAGALPEVCGDAALYCDPYDIDDIKNKIEMLLGDESLREELRQKGLERAKRFTWEKAAAAHMQVFEEVLAQ